MARRIASAAFSSTNNIYTPLLLGGARSNCWLSEILKTAKGASVTLHLVDLLLSFYSNGSHIFKLAAIFVMILLDFRSWRVMVCMCVGVCVFYSTQS